MSGRTRFARRRTLTRSGSGVVTAWPKDELRAHGLLDEDGELVDDVEVDVYHDEDQGKLQMELDLDER